MAVKSDEKGWRVVELGRWKRCVGVRMREGGRMGGWGEDGVDGVMERDGSGGERWIGGAKRDGEMECASEVLYQIRPPPVR